MSSTKSYRRLICHIISSKKEISKALLLKEYAQTLKYIRNRIKEAQAKSILSVNKELLKLYWYIGELKL
ncbi:hypothetical protein [Candidatus Babela massiliensis]|uniref:DUF1016 family protein n=1 Tax=Candidatus Babela massiliensis TaxID=673862 RepID=V6DIS6_9BACT|nr:hypothetical protein [Candidatus Babela massiliensis]CDK30838.1 hypothetical protein BABL1_gene_176 [Candidatus Babela massiliensis]